MNKQKKVIIGSVLVIVLLVGGLFGYGEWNRRKGEEANADAGERTQEDLYVTYQGKQYEYNHNLKNISNYKTLSYLFQTEPEEKGE